ncbi:MAG: alpha/beta hydrolase [Deltaproteobacteria bacterium]|jgi:pimeloyl-ACP methyl ester carboxylesterase
MNFETRSTTRSKPHLAYSIEGDRGPWVVLVMGLGMKGAAWRPQIEVLRETCRVVFFDNRGLGNSAPLDAETSRFDMKTLGTDVVRLMDELGIDRAHLGGVSLGGMISQHAALDHSDRFLSLTLIATHCGGPLTWLPPAPGIRHFLRAQRSRGQARLDAIEALLYPSRFREETNRAELDERMRVSFGGPPPKRVQRLQLRAVLGHDTAGRLPSLRLPTQVIAPDLDLLVRPSACRRLADLIPDARLHRIPDAGHGLIFQSADAINRWMLDHFAACEAVA